MVKDQDCQLVEAAIPGLAWAGKGRKAQNLDEADAALSAKPLLKAEQTKHPILSALLFVLPLD